VQCRFLPNRPRCRKYLGQVSSSHDLREAACTMDHRHSRVHNRARLWPEYRRPRRDPLGLGIGRRVYRPFPAREGQTFLEISNHRNPLPLTRETRKALLRALVRSRADGDLRVRPLNYEAMHGVMCPANAASTPNWRMHHFRHAAVLRTARSAKPSSRDVPTARGHKRMMQGDLTVRGRGRMTHLEAAAACT
jgi:hypothetical protein